MNRALEVAVVTAGTVRSAAAVAAVGFVLVGGFQVALALGAPWGKAAWGGAHERLPNGLRIASSFAAVLWLVAALVVLARAATTGRLSRSAWLGGEAGCCLACCCSARS